MSGRQLPKWVHFAIFFAENCMKMKEFGSQGGRASLAPPGSANKDSTIPSYHVQLNINKSKTSRNHVLFLNTRAPIIVKKGAINVYLTKNKAQQTKEQKLHRLNSLRNNSLNSLKLIKRPIDNNSNIIE